MLNPQVESPERIQNPLYMEVSRRSFIKASAVGLGLILLFRRFPNPIEAASFIRTEERMLIREPEPWSTRRWWPIFDTPAKKQNIPMLDAEFWSAWVYDNLGGAGDAWGQAIKKADTIRNNYPELVNSAGYCPWVSAAQLLEDEPEINQGEYLSGEDPLDSKIRALKEGLLVLKHSGAVMVQIENTADALLYNFTKGIRLSVDIPADRGSGNWFRAVAGVREDGEAVKATDFGKSHRNFPRSAIKSVWGVYPTNVSDVYQGVREKTSFWKYDIDTDFIDRLVKEPYYLSTKLS